MSAGFPTTGAMVRFVAQAPAAGCRARPIPVALTCGALEENAGNNRLMTGALRAAGYPATLHELPTCTTTRPGGTRSIRI